jgi:hypothetical protein
MEQNLSRYLLLVLLGSPLSLAAAEESVSLSGTIEANECAQVCGLCCGTHTITDSSGEIVLPVGNSFVDLAKFSDNQQQYPISGFFYQTSGQCGVNECTLFTVEKVDQPLAAEPSYDPSTGKLSIQSLVINSADKPRYSVTLTTPFNIDQADELSDENKIPQGDDCSASGAACADGTVCLSYFGIAGPAGGEFSSCEIPCSHPGASCPLGQSCQTVADGPGQVCVVD